MANSTPVRRQTLRPSMPAGGLRRRTQTWAAAMLGEGVLIGLLTLIALLAHGLNMFNNPGFAGLGDEGIYMSQAWAILRLGQLAPYTYFYDHAPGGWIMLAGWLAATGGPFTFGNAIDSGRVLMLLLHIAMVPLLYHVTRKLGAGMLAAAFAVLLFSLSPLAIYYQRLVLLDNMMIFWVLLSLTLLLDGWGRLSRVVLSGICFGIALVTKETGVFLIPAMLYIAVQQRWQHQGRFGVVGWLAPMGLVVSIYPLYAALKGELLPAGQSFGYFLFGGSGEHVSLVEALRWQATRGGGGMFNLNNQFWQFMRTAWLPRDAMLLTAGTVATVLNLVRGLRDRRALAAGLLGIFPIYYLARGGIVLEFYILFAIPFLCLNLAILLAPVVARVPARATTVLATITAVAIAAGYWQSGALRPLFVERPGDAARESVTWIKQYLPAESMIVAHDDPWTDLHEAGLGGPAFPNVHNHWKVALDPEIRYGVFKNDWRTVDYVLTLPGIESIFQANNDTVTLEALAHSHLVKRWEADGDVIELYKVDKSGTTESRLLAGSAAHISNGFEQQGAYVDADGNVTSEAQSYALLRAVWSDDRASFDRAWAWTKAHLMNDDGLLYWLWRDGKVVDTHAATDADTDTALALLLASKRWNEPKLREAGERMVQAIWEREVTTVNGEPYITAGDWATKGPVVALNPSYFAPYAYRIFKEVDPGHDWQAVIDTGYRTLFDASRDPLGAAKSAGLPPDWVGLDLETGKLVPLKLNKGDTTQYGFDAARTYWRVALDLRWSGDGRANSYLRQAGFLRDEVTRVLQDGRTQKGFVSGVYTHDGRVVQEAPSVVGLSGGLAALLTLDPNAAHLLHAGQIVGGATVNGEYIHWTNAEDLYAQEWGWFGVALYADALPDLWHKR